MSRTKQSKPFTLEPLPSCASEGLATPYNLLCPAFLSIQSISLQQEREHLLHFFAQSRHSGFKKNLIDGFQTNFTGICID